MWNIIARTAGLATLALAGAAAQALPPESVQLDQAERPDVTAQQKYQTMVNEAAGAQKINLAACRAQAAADRANCQREAQNLYRADMAKAREVRNHPERGTSVVVQTEIRSTETPIKLQ